MRHQHHPTDMVVMCLSNFSLFWQPQEGWPGALRVWQTLPNCFFALRGSLESPKLLYGTRRSPH